MKITIKEACNLFNNICKEANNNFDLYMFNFNEVIHYNEFLKTENFMFPFINLNSLHISSERVNVLYKCGQEGYFPFSETNEIRGAIEETKKLIDKLVKRNYDEFKVIVKISDVKSFPYATLFIEAKKINFF